jgi:2-C-methyl-D-erythritol 2,4-cyclodiphosphate synthase
MHDFILGGEKMFRIGFGVDSHAFEETLTGKKLIIGGVEVPNHLAVKSYSDGDVIIHSLFNALSSAIGEKSIGQFFPDNDPVNMQRDSMNYISFIHPLVRKKGYVISNVVFSLECKTPKISPLESRIKEVLSRKLEISPGAISVHATTGEGLTSFGQGKGIYCQAVVLLEKDS